MSVKIIGSTSGFVAEVDSNNNVKTNLPTTAAQAGFAKMLSQVDSGSVTGSASNREVEVTDDYRVRVGVDTLLFAETFTGAALNSALFTSVVSTMTTAVSGGFLVLNSGSSTASGAVARVQSYRNFPAYGTYPTYVEFLAQLAFTPVSNNVTEWGVGIASGTAAPTDGVFFRLNAAGELRCVINFNGTESQSSALNFSTLVGTNTTRHFIIAITEDAAEFWIDEVLVARVVRPVAQGNITASGNLPILVRSYNTAITSSAQQIKVGMVTASIGDMNNNKPWPHVLCGMGNAAYQGQTGGTMGTTASYANSADPTAAAALSNTAALVTGLGGQFRFNAAVTAVTDGIVTSFQVPLGTAALPGKSLYITGIKISCANLGAAVATSSTTLAWSIAYGHNAVSLATAEGATTKAPRRIALGIQNWPIAAPIGAQPDRGDLYMPFSTCPIVVQPGEFIATVAKFIIGTATAAQVIWGHVTFEGYFE